MTPRSASLLPGTVTLKHIPDTQIPRPASSDDERGSGSMLTVCIVLLACLMAYGVVVYVAWLGCVHRAQSAADMAALAGAHAMAVNKDACGEARRIARENAAEVTECSTQRGIGEYVVDVTVTVPLEPSLPGAPTKITESATAGEVQR